MNIIKECQDVTAEYRGRQPETTTYCQLSAPESDSSLKTLTALFNEAKKDFPSLREEDVTVSRREALTGISKMIAGAAGPVSVDAISFTAPGAPPASYRRLKPSGFAQG